MPTKITMPQLGESVAEGTIGQWLKNEGDMVKKDESLVEIITDKVTAELPSPVSGRLVKILVPADETVKVGVDIAEIDESGASASASASASTSSSATAASAPTMGTQGASAGLTLSDADAVKGTAGLDSAMPTNGRHAQATAVQEKVSPLARRLAQEHQIDLNAIRGTGEGGRIRKEDILAYVEQRSQPGPAPMPSAPMPFSPMPFSPMPFSPMPALDTGVPLAPRAPSAPVSHVPPVVAGAEDELVTPSPARRAIAEHMVRSKHTAPHATTLVEVDMTSLAKWLDQHREQFKQREGYGISFQTFVIKAAVEALKEHPYMNASWTEDNKVILRRNISIGVSIALDNNLIVPVIKNADTLNLAGIARAVGDLVARARGNKLMPADVQGATFTVNNPGVFGTLISVAIINQPNAGILTMDAVVKRPVVIDDAIAIRSMMYMSLSFDHRVLDGLTAAQFLGAIKRRLESWGPEIDVY